ncbi:MAG TPA: lipase maturation factor family protein, partial [Actinomycetota bacterium]|nr:lipase maturation factor family protein [Actinomycetota bacterium]
LLIAGVPQAGPVWVPALAWLALWAVYLSILNVGQIFYAFGWESLLVETGFYAIFLGSARTFPPTVVLWLLRWLLFRLEFGAGLIKLRGGDPCWRDLSCLYYHHETQPMPNPLSWFFHRLPKPIHRMEVAGNHVAQLVVPFGLFAPQPIASVAGLIVIAHQSWLVLSGNFSWLNAATIALAFVALDDRRLGHVLPFHHGRLQPLPLPFAVLVIAFGVLVVTLSWWPLRNLLSRRQLMNASFNSLHLVNTYGAFGSITKERFEVVIEGTASPEAGPGAEWLAYEFKGKPGDPRRRPPQVAPYHLRLDWLMWFAAMSWPGEHRWIVALVDKLLQGDPGTLKLVRRNPFRDHPPALIRASLYRYRYTSRAERRTTGAWWLRTWEGDYLPPSRLRVRPAAPGTP